MSETKILTVFYSRGGSTGDVARKIAAAAQGDIEEIIDLDSRKGILGFIKSGRGAMKGIPGRIKPAVKNPAEYDVVAVGSPVWASHVSCAVRAYLEQNREKIREVAFFGTSGGEDPGKVFEDMAELCKRKPAAKLHLSQKQVKNGDFDSNIESFVTNLKDCGKNFKKP